ncbi:hypothetical protein ACFLY4_10460 [Chloroflexota bacterium]
MLNRLRYPLLLLSLLLLLAAIWAGLVRMDWRWLAILPTLPFSHGPLMVSGFLGTLIGPERAIAISARWAYLGPSATALGALLLTFGVGGSLGAVLITLGSLVLLLVFIFILRQHLALYTVTMTLGALVSRVVADLAGLWQFRLWTGLLNALSLSLFIITMMVLVVRGRKSGDPPPSQAGVLH